MKAIIVGGGVVGSWAALALKRRGFEPTIYLDPTGRFAAPAGGIGIIEDQGLPGADSGLISAEDLQQCYIKSDQVWRAFAADMAWSDLVRVRYVQYVYRTEKDPSALSDLAPSCMGTILNRDELSSQLQARGFVSAVRFFAPVISPRGVLNRLHDQLRALGVGFVYERVDSLDRFENEPLVLETTGLGRRMFFNDTTIRPRRGQTMVLKGTHGLTEVIGAPGDPVSFNVVPWDEQTIVLGATKELDSTDEIPSEETARLLLNGCAELCPKLMEMRIESSPVAFRPTRASLLLEKIERRSGTTWIANGFGGGGWSVCHSFAERLAEMIAA